MQVEFFQNLEKGASVRTSGQNWSSVKIFYYIKSSKLN